MHLVEYPRRSRIGKEWNSYCRNLQQCIYFPARSTSQAKGISTPRLVEIPHPLAGIAPDEVQKKAENAVDKIIAMLLG